MPDFGRWTSNGGDPSLNEINRTDRFIEALSLDRPVYSTDPGEAELAHLLAGWRDDARLGPVTGIVTTRDAVAALNRGAARSRNRLPMAVVGSVAAAVLCLGGFGATVYGAGPGDALYGVRGMLFGEQHVTRDVQVELASSELAQVQQLIDDGQWQEAQEKLQTITTTVATVGDAEQKQELVDQWQQLSVKVENRDANATVPPDAPPVVLPEVTVTTTTPTTTESSGSETSTTPPSETSTTGSSDTTTPTTSSTESSSPSETTEPTTTTVTSPSEPGTTTSRPPVELPPSSASTSAPTSATTVPSATHTTTTTMPTVTMPAVTEPESGDDAPVTQEAPRGQRSEEATTTTTLVAPIVELPLLPGGDGQR